MPTRRIVNASPLILLAKIGRIDLLQSEGVDVVIPMAVLEEISADPENPADPMVQAIDDAGFQVATVSPPVSDSVKQHKLDKGEESVIALALQNPGCEVVPTTWRAANVPPRMASRWSARSGS